MGKLCLILAIHNHQPVGNFDSVLEEAYQKSYLPFLRTVKKYPEIKLALHYSGNLLLWLKNKHRDFFDSLRALTENGRIEILSGGFYEPILPAISDDDKIGQIKRLNDFIKKEFGCTPKGIWLAERVWEPSLPRHIHAADIEYLPVDDYHFKLTGLADKDLHGYFLTEDEGYEVKIFPGSERLRYLIPFKDVDKVISYLRSVFEDSSLVTRQDAQRPHSSLICMADDGEKFGLWPGTYEHVYPNGWLNRFFSALNENSDWLQTITFSEYTSKNPPTGRIYLPTASYREMGEWALFYPASEDYEDTFNTLKKLFGDEKAQDIMKGGFWKNFLSKYPESNHIHKRMFQISKKVHKAVKRLKSGVRSKKSEVKKITSHASRLTPHELLDELYQGQCNDAYWHGIFGGLYLPHLRSSLYTHLLKAEALSEQVLGLTHYSEKDDIDKDGYRDIFLSTQHLSLFLTEKGGSLYELSYKDKAVNIMDTLSRRHEHYHKKLLESHTHNSALSSSKTATIHEICAVKEKDIANSLIFDTYRKSSLIDHFIPKDTTIEIFKENNYQESGSFIETPYNMRLKNRKASFDVELSKTANVSGLPITVKKSVSIKKVKPEMNITYNVNPVRKLGCGFLSNEVNPIAADRANIFKNTKFCIEFNLSLLGSPMVEIISSGVSNKQWSINSTKEEKGLRLFTLNDKHIHMSVTFEFNKPITLWQFPIETVSSSESGVEKVYQGTTFIIFPDFEEKPFSFMVTLKNYNLN